MNSEHHPLSALQIVLKNKSWFKKFLGVFLSLQTVMFLCEKGCNNTKKYYYAKMRFCDYEMTLYEDEFYSGPK